MPTIFILRHGQVPSNAEGLYIGNRDYLGDPKTGGRLEDLTEEGIKQANLVGALLSRDEGVDVMYTSPLIRARHTAQIVASYLPAVSPQIDRRLSELDTGIFDGRRPDEVEALDPIEYLKRKTEKFTFRPTNGESYQMVARRARDFAADLRERHPEDNVAIVAHQGTNRALIQSLVGEERLPNEKMVELEVPQTGYFKVSYDGELPFVSMILDPLPDMIHDA